MCAARRRQSGFTLVEALAALAFLAIVIPVAVQGLRVATLASQVALRKAEAARIADRLLGEFIATGQWKQGSTGTVREGEREFRWQVLTQTWDRDALKLVTLQVTYVVQNQNYDLRLSTLLDPDAP